MVGADPIEPQTPEAELDDGSSRFPGVVLSPPFSTDPEPQLSLMVFRVDVAQSSRSDQGIVRPESNSKVGRTPVLGVKVLLLDPLQRMVQLVWMRNRQCGVGDFALPG